LLSSEVSWSFDEKIAHLGGELERIAVGDDDVGNLAALERADLISETKNFGWIQVTAFSASS